VPRSLLVAALLVLHAALASAQLRSDPDSIRRLVPRAFRNVPEALQRDLEARACRVPQPWGERAVTNVIQGAFTAARVSEWAILCSLGDTSRILIYRMGPGRTAQLVDSLLPAADVDWMQGAGGNHLGYSRLLRTLPLRITRAWRTDIDNHAIPQPVDHDAIEQVFVGKGAEAFYYAGGRWHRRVTGD
jgi:hypothetical protein